MPEPSQQLYGVNTTVNIADNLMARVKDPLWFLAMQWRTGEFEAENGGRVAHIQISGSEHDLVSVTRGGTSQPIDLDHPLEAVVESEDDLGSPAWRSAALEYSFGAATKGHDLVASEYTGSHLDWYHFDLDGVRDVTADRTVTADILPAKARIQGTPHTRWWRFEQSRDALGGTADPEPNVLSTLLPEFSMIDADNWFVVPLRQRAGTIRELTAVTVVDSFGIKTSLGPAIESWGPTAWGTFVLDAERAAPNSADGRLHFVPNIALEVLHNDEVEEVRFLRDEESNVVWAYERLVHTPEGERIYHGDAGAGRGGGGNGAAVGERFVLADDVPVGWIPYVARQLQPSSGADGEIYLRRARAQEDPVAARPRSRVVGESWRLDEHEIPRTGIRVRRIRRFARGSDGSELFWIGRQKDAALRTAGPMLRSDYLTED